MHLHCVPYDRDRMPDTHQHLFGDRDREAYHIGIVKKFSLEGAIEPTIPARANNRLPSST
jgi:hypothetical protein